MPDGVEQKLNALEEDIREIKADVREIKRDIQNLFQQYSYVNATVNMMKNGFNRIQDDMEQMEEMQHNTSLQIRSFLFDFVKMFFAAVLALTLKINLA